MFSTTVNIATIACLAFVVGSLAFLAGAYQRTEKHAQIRTLTAILAISVFTASLLYGAFFAFTQPLFKFEANPAVLASIWLNLLAGAIGLILIYANSRSSSQRHAETVLFALAIYALGCLSFCYMAYFTCLFGTATLPAYFAADIGLNLSLLATAFLMWCYVLSITGFTDRRAHLLTRIIAAASLVDAVLITTSPLTGLLIAPGEPDVMGTQVPDTYLIQIVWYSIIVICIITVALKSKIDPAEKFALVLLGLTIPIAVAIMSFVTDFYVSSIIAVSCLCACYLGISHRRDQEITRHMTQVDLAKTIQQGMLPSAPPADPRFRVAAHMWPAKEVAGDFYDFYQPDADTLYLAMADVSGKDIPAAMFMSRAHALIREFESQGLAPNEILNRVNKELTEGNSEKLFVTAWIGKINLTTGLLTYANAGHNPPIVITDNNHMVEYLRTKANLVLGIRAKTSYSPHTLRLHTNDRLLLYTDGVTEAINLREEQYGEARLLALTENVLVKMPCGAQAAEALYEDVAAFAQGAEQFDDITVLCAAYCNKEPADAGFTEVRA